MEFCLVVPDVCIPKVLLEDLSHCPEIFPSFLQILYCFHFLYRSNFGGLHFLSIYTLFLVQALSIVIFESPKLKHQRTIQIQDNQSFLKARPNSRTFQGLFSSPRSNHLFTMASEIRTRLLILSDTHGADFGPDERPLQRADVAIHCGDLTDGSKLDEFRTALKLLKSIDAPLKLAIAGNHDFTLDASAFNQKIADASPPLDPTLVTKEYGVPGQVKQMFEDAKDAGIVLLEEGTHRFTLANGALLTVYASPYTPALGAWGFQYHPNNGRDFAIGQGVDIAITHGPPKGIMDYTYGRERAGCPDLFAAIAKSKPRVHCFGHIHEGWGATLVKWRESQPGSNIDERPSHFTAIENDNTVLIEKLARLKPAKYDSPEDTRVKTRKLEQIKRDRCWITSHCGDDEHPLVYGERTLFVNAAVSGCDEEDDVIQKPWLVDIGLPSASGRSL